MRSWLLFLRTAWLEWIDLPDVPLDDIREMCVTALVGALNGLPEDVRPDLLESSAEARPTA